MRTFSGIQTPPPLPESIARNHRHIMHLPARLAVTIGSLALVLGGSMTAAQAESVTSDVVGHLYVNDNTAGMNTVAGFDRHTDGSLSPIEGSPFAAGALAQGRVSGLKVRSRRR